MYGPVINCGGGLVDLDDIAGVSGWAPSFPRSPAAAPAATRDHNFFLKNEGLYNRSYIQDSLDYRLGICGR